MTSNIVSFTKDSPPEYISGQIDNDVFIAGLPTLGIFPMISLDGGKFIVTRGASAIVIQKTQISCVLLSARPNLSKSYRASYGPSISGGGCPDCSSDDGRQPRSDTPLKQSELCDGCPQNHPGIGNKACRNSKILAIYADGEVYGFKIPEESFEPFREYVSSANRHPAGDLTKVTTVIGIERDQPKNKLVFGFGGFLKADHIVKIDMIKNSPVVNCIVGGDQPVTLLTTELSCVGDDEILSGLGGGIDSDKSEPPTLLNSPEKRTRPDSVLMDIMENIDS